MAKIVHSDLAPNEVVHYDLAGVEFELGGSGKSSFETDDRSLLASAEVHPWLSVEYPKVDVVAGEPRRTLADRPELDVLSGMHPDAKLVYDPDAIRKTEDLKAAAHLSPLAVDANLDQGEAQSVEAGDAEIGVTLAADEDHEAAKSAKAFEMSDEEEAGKLTSGQLDPTGEVTVREAIAPDTDDKKTTSRKSAKEND